MAELPTANLLTIGDVYKPHQADDFVKLVQFGDELQNAKLRNRIAAEQMGEMEFNKRQRDAQIQAAGGEQAFFEQQAKMAKQAQITEEMTKGSALLKSYRTVLGTKGLADNWEKIKTTLPESMQGLDPKNFTEDGYVVKDANGKPLGQWVDNPGGGPPRFVPTPREPTSVDAILLKGIESRLTKEHGPGTQDPWSADRVQLEAAKEVKKMNVEEWRGKKEFDTDQGIRKQKAQEDRAQQKSFAGWDPEVKESAFKDFLLTGKEPKFAWGDKNSYTAFTKEYYGWLNKKGTTIGGTAATRASYKSDVHSLQVQQRIYDMMDSFTTNLGKQIAEVKTRYKALPRTSMKLFNMPIRELRKYVTGSGDEAAVKSFLIEISNEIGKLSTGSAASIRELGEQAQKQWKEVHDETLSYSDLSKVLDSTEQQAGMRMKSSEDVIDKTTGRVRKLLGEPEGGQVSPLPPIPGTITRDPRKPEDNDPVAFINKWRNR